MGMRPINGVFVDMTVYANMFKRYQESGFIEYSDDYGFYYFLELCGDYMNVETFFFVCACLYVLPLFFLSKKLFRQYWFYSFLILCGSFSFWSYGTNGIRNGIATSIFLLAFFYRKNRPLLIGTMILACSFHQSLLLPTLAYIVSIYYRSSKGYLLFWFSSILISLVLGNYLVLLVGGAGFGTEKVGAYFTENVNEEFRGMGFRWDFIIYSSLAVFSGWYYIFKKKINDVFYNQMYNIFLIANAAWILVIRVNFSNRFAYLSWFMMGLIIIYPLLTNKILKYQNFKIGAVVIIYYSFTYLMNVVLA
ncbi:EpsG family protein [Tenacibaculum holothuriorum]|nr:EpsG family protein [Tenacibaculum holothuriorum]